MEAPPPPPPHGAGATGGKSGGLPDGKYDIFVIPPTSSGSGFLYLPSLQTQRNSFLAGCACTTFAFAVWNIMVPAVKNWLFDTMNGGGSGVVVLILLVGIVAWAVGKTQAESEQDKGGPGSSSAGSKQNFNTNGVPPQPNTSPPPPKSSWQRPQSTPNPGQKSAWEKAREETRKREEEKKKAEEAKRKVEELEKRRAELEKERQKQREKDLKERLERERKEREEKTKAEKPSPTKRQPTARTEDEDDAYSFRPYDRPKYKANSGASVYSESSYAPSQSTARTTPPPEFTGPYLTKDPDKIMIKGVFSFNNAFMRTPIAQLVSGRKPVSDGLILRMTSEGLFIDDDRRNEPQREWDVKVWTMKLVEVCCVPLSCRL
jgi:outer membrane biosynthesis protein TonB